MSRCGSQFESLLTYPKAASAEEEVGWDEDDSESESESDSDSDSDSDSKATAPSKPITKVDRPASTESSTTIHPPAARPGLLKPVEPRKSNDERSQADSDASYDVVGATSGVPSRAPNSPKEARKADDSDEEDWE